MTGPDAIAAMEARLLAVERRCVRLEDDTRQLARGLGLSRQRTWESWTDWRPRPASAAAAGGNNTTAFGFVFGCSNTGDAGGTLDLSIGGSSVWTGSCDATGFYSASFFLASNATGTFTFTPSSSRFGTLTFTQAMTAGASNSTATARMVAASGYHCWNACTFPLADTLTLVDSAFGTFTIAYGTGPGGASSWSKDVGTPGLTTASLNGLTGNFSYNAAVQPVLTKVCPTGTVNLVFGTSGGRTWTWHE